MVLSLLSLLLLDPHHSKDHGILSMTQPSGRVMICAPLFWRPGIGNLWHMARQGKPPGRPGQFVYLSAHATSCSPHWLRAANRSQWELRLDKPVDAAEQGPQPDAVTDRPPSCEGSSAEERMAWYGIATLTSALLLVGRCLQSWAPGQQPPLSGRQALKSAQNRQGKLRLQKWYVPLSDKEKKKITRELVQTVLARKPKMCSFLEWRDLKIVYKSFSAPLAQCSWQPGSTVAEPQPDLVLWVARWWQRRQPPVLQAAPEGGWLWHGKQGWEVREWSGDREQGVVDGAGVPGKLSGHEKCGGLDKRYASLYFCCAIEDQDNELITLEIIHRYVELLDKYFGSVCELDIIFNFEKAYFILDEFLLGGEVQETSKKNVLKAIEQADLLQEVGIDISTVFQKNCSNF
ncbi:AP-1 complex subunit sigma-2 [Chelonia mydas]|uniref:AP-1 complex subunit sigma-2 n=4 Tax=Archelosauria TaxID=1329799 RepID=M7AKL5_CHEMY|nr:AP-1 complex subunit sigma-2 [Chelonia mydas]